LVWFVLVDAIVAMRGEMGLWWTTRFLLPSSAEREKEREQLYD